MKANYDCTGNKIFLADEMVAPEGDFDQAIYFQKGQEVKEEEGEEFTSMDVKIYNRDGSEAGNCLNGMRALSDLAFTQLGVRGRIKFLQEGLLLAETFRNQEETGVMVDFPRYEPGEVGTPDKVHLGNEHHVHWKVNEVVNVPMNYMPKENEEYVLNRHERDIFAIVYEAGAGETLSCGSGAAAIAFSAFQRYGQRESFIHYPGGELHVQIGDDKIFLSGRLRRL